MLKYWAIFVAKILILTLLFTIAWIFLLYNQPRKAPAGDHTHEKETISIEQRFDEKQIVSQQRRQDANALIDSLIEQVEELEKLDQQEHNAAELSEQEVAKNLQLLCSVYADICNKTIREQEPKLLEKLFYQALIIAKISETDKLLKQENSLRDTLDFVKIFNDAHARRGSAGHTYVKLNTNDLKNRSEFREVMTHEFGHIVDLGMLNGTGRTKHSKFTEFGRPQRPLNDPSIPFYTIAWNSESVKKPETDKFDFVSGYAMKGIYEDFAEGFNLYLNHNAIFKKMSESSDLLKQKYAFYDSLFDGEYFNSSESFALRMQPTTRFWDTTKISTDFGS